MPDVIKVEKLSKQYRIGNGSPTYLTLRDTLVEVIEKPFSRFRNRNTSNGTHAPSSIWALNNVTFEVQAGEVIGVIGRNGSGKSTLLKILSRITPPTSGSAEIYGRSASLLEVGTGFHPELTGRENVYLNGAILGMSSSEIKQRFDEIVTFAEVEQFMNTPVKRYSTGMYLRLAFAVAAHLRTEILFIDEVLAVGDMEFQRKCLGKVEGVAKEGRTVILVSHNLGAVARLCQRAFWLDEGILKLEGCPRDVVAGYVSGSNTQMHHWERLRHEDVDESQKEMVLISVRLRQSDQQAGVLSFDLPFKIEVEHQVKKPASELRILLRIVSESGTVIFTSSDLDTPHTADDRCRTEGRYLSVCTVPGKLLKPGKFFLTIGSQRYGSWIELYENLLMFEVSAVGTRYISRLGVITPILDWDVCKLV